MDEDRIPVAQFMTSGVLTVTPETTVSDAANTLLEEDVGSLVVVDEDDRPVGMFTTTDLAEIVSERESGANSTVEQYMTGQVVSIGARDSVRDAAAKMIVNGVHHLPVTDDGSVVGMLSTMDLTAYFSYSEGTDAE
jgi:CBS domain-containing protein